MKYKMNDGGKAKISKKKEVIKKEKEKEKDTEEKKVKDKLAIQRWRKKTCCKKKLKKLQRKQWHSMKKVDFLSLLYMI